MKEAFLDALLYWAFAKDNKPIGALVDQMRKKVKGNTCAKIEYWFRVLKGRFGV